MVRVELVAAPVGAARTHELRGDGAQDVERWWRLCLARYNDFFRWERIVLNSAPTRQRPSEPLRYLCQAAAIVRAPIFEDAIDRFVQSTLDQLDAKQIKDTNLATIWQNVMDERSSSDVAVRRKLEALLGYDVDEANETLIERLSQDSRELGEAGVQELAASYNGKSESRVLAKSKTQTLLDFRAKLT